jgi:ribose 5-phosphate isomerase B
MKISIGSDHGGLALADRTTQHLLLNFYEVIAHSPGFNCQKVDYPDYAFAVTADIVDGLAEYGILVCRSGIGMSIAANKCKNIRAALCGSPMLALSARKHNNANVLCLGADYLDEQTALAIIDTFLGTKFSGDKHQLRLEKISNYEKKHYHDV